MSLELILFLAMVAEYVSKQGVTKMEINVTKKEVTAHGLNYEIKHI